MRSKKLLVTLIVALMFILTGCAATSNLSEESSPQKEVPEIIENEPSRFSAENMTISGINNEIDFSCVITDHKTGKQFLYIQGYGYRVTMVELGYTEK